MTVGTSASRRRQSRVLRTTPAATGDTALQPAQPGFKKTPTLLRVYHKNFVKISISNAVLYLSILIHTFVENNYREMDLRLVNSERPPKQQQFSGHFCEPAGLQGIFLTYRNTGIFYYAQKRNEQHCVVVLRKV
jgi:hypothetical protein